MTSQTASTSLPSAEQLLAARSRQWHQDGNALLSQEALRDWLNRSGLVLYAPRAQQLGAPAPSLVEATLGKAEPEPSVADSETARALLARLVAEGAAVPLNLLGATGGLGTDVPDFVVSAAVFSYIFTLRGNKAWKQAPATSGAVKVSPLALAAYEMLAAKVTLSAYDLTTQLGKEVTEAAVLRALTELWSQLRVIPVPQVDGSATLWELASARFTKQIKSGVNAGQPSALSALISLYLGQAISATEDEIESFLSPLSPRSRTRDVLHALLSARQLETLVIDGKTLLHVGGELPTFAPAVAAEQREGEAETGADGAPRIAKFTPRPGSKLGTGLRSRPAAGARPAFGSKPAYGKPAGDRERRPFRKEARPGLGAGRPAPGGASRFDKPWQEERSARPAAEGPEASSEQTEPASRPSFAPRPSSGSGGFERKPASDRRPGGRPPFGKPGFAKSGEGRPPRREFSPRAEGGGDAVGTGPRKTFSKPGTFGRKRESAGGKPAFGGAEGRPPRRDFNAAASGESGRPPRREFGAREERPAGAGPKRPGTYAPRPGGKPGFSAKPAFGARPAGARSSGEAGAEGAEPRKIFRKFDAPRGPKPLGSKPSGARPYRSASAGAGSFGNDRSTAGERPARPAADRPTRPFSPRPSSNRSASDRPARPFADRAAGGDRPRAEGRPAFGGKGGGGAAGKSASFARGGSPFAKFADGKKPFRKPGPGKPAGNSSGPKRAGGGFSPVKRQRPGQG